MSSSSVTVILVAIDAPSCSSSKYSRTSSCMSKRFLRSELCVNFSSRGAVRNCTIAESQVVHYKKIITWWVGSMIQETYNLVPAPRMLLVTWISSQTEPRSSYLVASIVRQLSVGFGRSKRLDCLSNFAANQVEGLIFGKPIESGFIGWEWAEVWGHFVTGKGGTSESLT